MIRLAVSGPIGSGKTSYLLRLSAILAREGESVGGVVQRRLVEEGRVVGYTLRDVATGEEIPLMHRVEGEFPWAIQHDAWAWAARRVAEAVSRGFGIIWDEWGLLEERGEGHAPAAHHLRGAPWAVFGVRASALAAIDQRIGPFSAVLSPSEDPREALAWLR